MTISLRSLLVLVTLCGALLSCAMNHYRSKALAISAIQQLGGTVAFDYQWTESRAWSPNAVPPGPNWLKPVLGEHYRAEVVEIQLFAGPGQSPEKFTDEDLIKLKVLTEVKWLVLMDTKVSDAGLKHLSDFPHLERLDLEGTAVTESGIAELQRRMPHTQISY